METNQFQLPTALHRFNWMQLPALCARLSRKLLVAVTDGYAYASVRAGAIITPLVFLAGFIWGWQHFDYRYVYTESRWFLITAIVLGTLGGHTGLFFTAGFIIGDFFFSGSHYGNVRGITASLALVISYIVLIFVTVAQPVIIKYLVAEIKWPPTIPFNIRMVAAGLLYAALTYFYIYFWTKMSPVLIRPVFTWHGGQPTVDAITVLQNKTQWLVWPAVIAAVLRFALQAVWALQPGRQAFYQDAEAYYIKLSERNTLTSFIPLPVKVFLYSCITALSLSGMLLDWKSGLAAGTLAFFFQALTAGLVPRPKWLNHWAALVYKIPSLFRLLAAFLALYAVSDFVIRRMWKDNTNAFLPLVVAFCCAFLIFFLFNPGKPLKPQSHENNS